MIPRIGASVTFYGATVLRRFGMMDVYPLAESVAITRSRDILRSNQGPVVMAVDSSPGLEGIEAAKEKDIAGIIIQFIEKNARPHNTKTRGKGWFHSVSRIQDSEFQDTAGGGCPYPTFSNNKAVFDVVETVMLMPVYQYGPCGHFAVDE